MSYVLRDRGGSGLLEDYYIKIQGFDRSLSLSCTRDLSKARKFSTKEGAEKKLHYLGGFSNLEVVELAEGKLTKSELTTIARHLLKFEETRLLGFRVMVQIEQEEGREE